MKLFILSTFALVMLGCGPPEVVARSCSTAHFEGAVLNLDAGASASSAPEITFENKNTMIRLENFPLVDGQRVGYLNFKPTNSGEYGLLIGLQRNGQIEDYSSLASKVQITSGGNMATPVRFPVGCPELPDFYKIHVTRPELATFRFGPFRESESPIMFLVFQGIPLSEAMQ